MSRPAGLDFQALFTVAPTPYAVLAPDLVVLEANPAYLDATGRRREEIVGRRVFDAFPDNPADPQAIGLGNLRASLERARETGRPDTMAVQRFDIAVEGTERVEVRYWSPTNVALLDSDGRTTLILHRAEDVTAAMREKERGQVERERAEGWRRRSQEVESDLSARVRELEERNAELRAARDLLAVSALHDPLTGLLVRSVFVEQVSHALSRLARHPHSVGVLFIDLDRLKHVNDTYGHAAGDRLLRWCGDRLRASVRPSDAVARVGGDEFVVLLDDLHDRSEAEVVARRVLASLNTDCDVGDGPLVPTTASVGVAVADSPSITAELLVSHADAAMYRAKQSGRARFELFDEAAYTAASARQRLETELRGALAGDQLRLHYQPIIDLTTGGTHAVEALLRWEHPVSGLLPAGDFISLAEDSGVIVELGPWVVAQACQQLARWDASLGDRAPQRLFINLSVGELAQPRLADQLAAAVAAAGITPDRLVLEITETGVMHEPSDGGTLKGLLRLGCELAIDDFGTGYSSLSRLARVPASIIKIDRSFARDLHSGPEAAAVVSAVLLLAHNLRKTVVAEGVEDARTLAALRDLGCEYAQGYHLAHPQHADTLSEGLRRAS